MIKSIRELMKDYKKRIREELPKIYRQELLNNLFSNPPSNLFSNPFRHPYTKIQFVHHDLSVSRLTATKYLDQLAKKGFLQRQKKGRTYYFVNTPLYELLVQSTS
jgi:Fic family protein